MSKKTIKKITQKIAEKSIIPFDKLVVMPIPQNAVLDGVKAIFQNSRYTVSVKHFDQDSFVGPDGKPTQMAHIIVIDTCGYGLPYEDRVKIKNAVCGPNAEMVELIPGEWRNQTSWVNYHFWCLPIGAMFPFGFVPNDAEGAIMETGGAVGDGLGVSQEDLQLFMIHDDGFTLIYADRDDAESGYGEEGSDIVDTGRVIQLFEAPVEGTENVGWSELARKKFIMMYARLADTMPEVKDVPVPVNEGDISADVPCEYEPEDAIDVETEEDRVFMAESMANGIAERQKARQDRVDAVSSVLSEGLSSISEDTDKVKSMSDD